MQERVGLDFDQLLPSEMKALATLCIALCIFLPGTVTIAQLSVGYYDKSCPLFEEIVRDELRQVVANDPFLLPSLLKLQFRVCFPHGCSVSILLQENPNFLNSVRSFGLIDKIKSRAEAICPSTVSCTDIIVVAARDSVNLTGGPFWSVPLGRKDVVTSSQSAGYKQIASLSADPPKITAMFEDAGFTPDEMVALIGGHTVGQAPCKVFASPRSGCPICGGDASTAPIDDLTPSSFDNNVFRNLLAGQDGLPIDQMLFNGGPLDAIVKHYSENSTAFFENFVAAIKKMANIRPLNRTSRFMGGTCTGRK